MNECLNMGILWKGSICEVRLPLVCRMVDVEQAESVIVRLFTSDSQVCIEKNKDEMTIEGNVAIITLPVIDIDALEDGALRYTVLIDGLVVDERSSRYYVKTPTNLIPSGGGITKAEAQELIDEAIEQETGRTEDTYQKTLIAGENITIEGNVISSTGGISSEEVEEMIGAAIEAETARTEETYLKEHQSLEGYATESWVEGKGYQDESDVISIVEAETSDLPTDAEVEEMIESAFNSREKHYRKLQKLDDHFYDIEYDAIDYDYAYEYFNNIPNPFVGGCTCIVKDNLIGRNYDWLYDEEVGFAVHTPSANGRNKVDGVAGSLSALTKDVVEQYGNEEAYKILPFYLQDGHNEYGLFAEMNVVPASGNTRTIPAIEKRDSVCAIMLVRYILDNFGKENDTDEIIDYLNNYVEIYFPQTLIDKGFELHYMLQSVGNNPVVIEIYDNHLVSIKNDNQMFLTNFRLYGTELYDNRYNTPFTANSGLYPRDNGIEDYGSGIERANIVLQSFDGIEDEYDMQELLENLYFSKAYSDSGDETWYSEFVGGSINVNTPSNSQSFQDRVALYRQKWEERSRENPEVWITCHSSIYNLENGNMIVWSNEREDSNGDFVYYIDQTDQLLDVIGASIEEAIEAETARTESTYAKPSSIPTKLSQLQNDFEYVTQGDMEFFVDSEISEWMGAETARTESTYLKAHQSLEGYATESWVEGKGYQDESDVEALIEAEISDMPTDAEMDAAIEAAIEAETARTESTYLKEHQSLEGYATEEWVEGKGYQDESDVEALIEAETGRTEDTYQKILTAGEGVVIENNVISFAGVDTSGITEAKAQQMIDASIAIETGRTENIYAKKSSVPTKMSQLQNDYEYVTQGDMEFFVDNDISEWMGAETARTESTYLKAHQSLEGYATESWVEGKGYQDESDVEALIEAEISDMPTDAEMDASIEAAIEAETARTESTYLKAHQSLEGYATESWVEGKGYQNRSDVEAFIEAETARTESTYLKAHQSLEGYATESWVEGKGYQNRSDVEAFIDAETARTESTYAKPASIPTKLSQLQNDYEYVTQGDMEFFVDSDISEWMGAETARTESTYLKEHQSLANYYTKQEISALNHVSSTSIADIWTGTQAQYDAMTGHTQTTLYIIKD